MFALVGNVLIFLGLMLVFSAAIGCIRLPDFFTKMHAATVGDAVGCPLILIGIAIQSSNFQSFAKVLVLALILLIINPTASFLLNNIALKQGLPTELKQDEKGD
jgi:multicomponent Na+:H+ antiporter subunit G